MPNQPDLNLCYPLAPLCTRRPGGERTRECFIKLFPRGLLEVRGFLLLIGFELLMPLCGFRQIASYLRRQPANPIWKPMSPHSRQLRTCDIKPRCHLLLLVDVNDLGVHKYMRVRFRGVRSEQSPILVEVRKHIGVDGFIGASRNQVPGCDI